VSVCIWKRKLCVKKTPLKVHSLRLILLYNMRTTTPQNDGSNDVSPCIMYDIRRKVKVKQSHTGLGRLQEVEAPRFLDNRRMKVVRLSALRTGRLYPPGKIPDTHFCSRLSRPQGHSATEMFMSMKDSSDTIGNRTRDVPVCTVASTNCATAHLINIAT
jgi:hypothetical protein